MRVFRVHASRITCPGRHPVKELPEPQSIIKTVEAPIKTAKLAGIPLLLTLLESNCMLSTGLCCA